MAIKPRHTFLALGSVAAIAAVIITASPGALFRRDGRVAFANRNTADTKFYALTDLVRDQRVSNGYALSETIYQNPKSKPEHIFQALYVHPDAQIGFIDIGKIAYNEKTKSYVCEELSTSGLNFPKSQKILGRMYDFMKSRTKNLNKQPWPQHNAGIIYIGTCAPGQSIPLPGALDSVVPVHVMQGVSL